MSTAQAAFRSSGMWATVWKLLRLRLAIMVRGFRRAKTGGKIGYIAAALGLAAVMGFIVFISTVLLRLLQNPELVNIMGDISPLIESLPTLMVSVSALGILVTSFGLLLQALYLSGDMDFLMSAPIPIRAIFVAKLIQAVLPNFGLISAFTLPFLYGLGFAQGYNFLYFPFVLMVLVSISLAAAALASLLVMVVVRFFPARRVAEVLGFIVGTFFFVSSQSARFVRFNVNEQEVAGLLQIAARFNQPWSPLTWAGQGLVRLGSADWLPAAGLLVASLALTAAIFYVTLSTSERLYYTGWSSLQSNTRRKKAKPAARAIGTKSTQPQNSLIRLIPAPIRAIFLKDILLYRRDLRNLSQLLTPLILGIVYAISLLQSGGNSFEGRGEAPTWFMQALNGIMIYADVALALFLGWMLVSNLAGVGLSREGKNYWMIKAAPVSAWHLLVSKFLVGYLPSLLLSGVYLLVLQVLKGTAFWSAVMSLLAVSAAMAGLTGIYLSFGTRGANFDWENPAQQNKAVGCLGTIIGMVFLLVAFALFIVPPLLSGLLGIPVGIGQLIGLLFGGTAGIAVAYLPVKAVEKHVATLNEA